MKKEFYIGQPLIGKKTGERMVFLSDDGKSVIPISAWNGNGIRYFHSDDLEPSTEFKFSEIIAGLEQGYFEVGTEFEIKRSPEYRIEVSKGMNGLFLLDAVYGEGVKFNSRDINSTWTLVEPYKEMTLEEIQSELGYKIKLKDNV